MAGMRGEQTLKGENPALFKEGRRVLQGWGLSATISL